MPDLVTDSGSKEANEKHPKKPGGKGLSKYKWYVIGGLAVIAVIVFYISRKNSASNSSTGANTSAGTAAGVDPSTGLPYASEYGYGASNNSGAGVAGPAGATGATGATGAQGPPGKQGKPGKSPKPKKPIKRPVRQPVHKVASHPAMALASSHASNQSKAIRPRPAVRKAA